jgi:hypothetical protein
MENDYKKDILEDYNELISLLAGSLGSAFPSIDDIKEVNKVFHYKTKRN